jgi:hypothetical protein
MNSVTHLDEAAASGWQGTLHAFLAEKHRRSGSMRTVVGYSRMLNDFFGRTGKTPNQVTTKTLSLGPTASVYRVSNRPR